MAKQGIKDGTLKLLYVAPERLNNETFMLMMRDVRISLLAVDEVRRPFPSLDLCWIKLAGPLRLELGTFLPTRIPQSPTSRRRVPSRTRPRPHRYRDASSTARHLRILRD